MFSCHLFALVHYVEQIKNCENSAPEGEPGPCIYGGDNTGLLCPCAAFNVIRTALRRSPSADRGGPITTSKES